MHGIDVLTVGATSVVGARGELDAYVAPELTAALERAAEGEDSVVVDLEAVTFMDSTVLGVVVRAVRELSEAARAVKVVLPRGTARRVFEITTVERVLPVASSRADALDELVTARGTPG